AHDSQHRKNGDQRRKGRKLVEQVGSEKPKVVHDHDKRDAMASNIVEQLKESKCLKQKDEYQHEYPEITEKPAEQVQIHQQWQTTASRSVSLPVRPAAGGDAGCRRSNTHPAHANETHPSLEAAKRLEPSALPAELLHAR